MEAYNWRSVIDDDLGGLRALDAACLRADGPASVSGPNYGDLIGAPGVAMLCAENPSGGQIAALGWVRDRNAQALLGGKIHPEHRRKGLGTHVLRWCEEEASKLGSPSTLAIVNETLTEGSRALYEQEGYTCKFVEKWMQRDLGEPLPTIVNSFEQQPWTPGNARLFFQVYNEAFRERRAPGAAEPNPDEWISEYAEDPDFRPDLSLLALDEGKPVGFVTSGVMEIADLGRTVGWISQAGSLPEYRGRSAAAGLMLAVMEAFKREGLGEIGLHVNVDNPAAQLYERLGFRQMGQRARYFKPCAP